METFSCGDANNAERRAKDAIKNQMQQGMKVAA